MTIKRYSLDWSVGPIESADDKPDRLVPAQVPGAVQIDWGRANGIPSPEYAGNVTDYRWMEDSYWLYQARLDYPAPQAGENAYFCCGGVDYQFEVRIDGRLVHEQEGMFTPFEIDLTGVGAPGNLLEVLVFPAPKSHQEREYRSQANRSVKPSVSYGGAEFHPRLIPLGIWEETFVEIRPACYLRRVEMDYRLGEALDAASVQAVVTLSQPSEGTVRWRLLDPEGTTVMTRQADTDRTAIMLSAAIPQPRLWWPNEQGAQDLYNSLVELLDASGAVVDSHQSRLGFRRMRLVMHPTQWDDPEVAQWPIGPNKPPITLEVNGRRIFGKGSNWVTPDLFPGRVTVEYYRPLLELAKDAHFNLLRHWGGGGISKQAFYNLCDEMGIMVWQEFPLSCNRYEGKNFLKILDQESRAIIAGLRQHPCIILWCGGNELFDFWSGMTEQDHAIRLLNRNTYELDPQRPFLGTSPLYGFGHGSYLFERLDGTEIYAYFPKAHCTAYPESGVPGPASADYLRRIIPAQELFPPRPTPAWVLRHGFRAWDRGETSWLEYPTLVKYFGEPASLEEMVEMGQLLQAEGLKFFHEETRRQRPTCALGLSWCYNEPWPAAANSSVVSWPAEPKPALAAIKAALRPVLASARPEKFRWQAGETFTADLFLLNDAPEAFSAGTVEAALAAGGKEYPLLRWSFDKLIANTNLPGPSVRFLLPELEIRRFTLALRVKDHPEWDSVYTFVFTSQQAW
jgi:beta-mannosidase